ncbi:helix-turn-helix transcriptional regulator [Maritalea sp.]|uniref:helix-turn-helix transcriptional regulator n=1 Tax=Maritalea sp. TaxID=2003361 RepID=UPI003EF9E3C8
MRRAERLFRIIQIMRQANGAMTALQIANKLETSKRSIYRDMAHLVASGAPIDSEAGVGFMLRDEFDVPPMTFTFEQLEALAFGARAVANLADHAMAVAAKEALEKVKSVLPETHQKKLERNHLLAYPASGTEKLKSRIALARRSIEKCTKLNVTYLSLSETETKRILRPLGLISFGPIWLLTAWCETRRGFREFRLDRFSKLQPIDERFSQLPGQTLEDYHGSMSQSR